MIEGFWLLLFAMLVGHALADYPLQAEFVAKFKSHKAGLFMGEAIWPWILGSHALIHGGFVWAITGSATLGALEVAMHTGIDWMKCDGRTGFHTDQTLHVLCKVGYAAIVA